MKGIRKNLKEYSRQFDEADNAKRSSADKAVIENRRRLLDEWLAWRERTVEELVEERADYGLEELSEERKALVVEEDGDESKVVEEIFEEILEESEEVIE